MLYSVSIRHVRYAVCNSDREWYLAAGLRRLYLVTEPCTFTVNNAMQIRHRLRQLLHLPHSGFLPFPDVAIIRCTLRITMRPATFRDRLHCNLWGMRANHRDISGDNHRLANGMEVNCQASKPAEAERARTP